jgi:hypothetical protein
MASLWWEDNIKTQLLDEESLQHMFPYMCKIDAEDGDATPSCARHDPITNTVITFLTCPLHLGLTEVGAMIFQARSALVYPYNLMSERQKGFVRDCLARREEWNIFNEAVVFRRSKGTPPILIDPTTVLVALCSKVLLADAMQDSDASSRRVALCNIILQRVQGYIPIDKPVQKQLNEWMSSATMRNPPRV